MGAPAGNFGLDDNNYSFDYVNRPLQLNYAQEFDISKMIAKCRKAVRNL
jgi:hypothetical protein